jgi:23S rRNA (uracil1939-C5)-methyltransferase
MLTVGEHTEISINTVAFGGEGIGKYIDLVVFVPFTCGGDHVEVKITEVKKNYLKGLCERILNPSPYRTTPLCPYYTICGGCQYQHIQYEHQIELKTKQLQETFERIGKIKSPSIKKMIPSPQIYHYRAKADFQIQISQGEDPSVGFINNSGDSIINIERCEIVDASINKKLALFRGDLLAGKTSATKKRHIIWSDLDKEAPPEGKKNINLPNYIERLVKGKSMQIPYDSFFQINTSLVDELVDTIDRMSTLTGDEIVLDCYCGSGLFSVFLAPYADRVFGIDSDGKAINCARINVKREGINNVKFYRGDASIVINKEFIKAKIPVDFVLIDPPRRGCEGDVLAAIVALKPKKILYISCNPATQARDLRYLIDQGLSLKYVQPLDMFPQTQHIEAVALLEMS